MFIEQRHKEIAETVQRTGKISVAEISKKYGISDESARRDLRILESHGLCKRTYGGAIAPQQVSVRPPENRDYNSMPIFENYRLIALRAAALINENDVVYLTGGSFGHIMLPYLPKNKRFTLLINNIELGSQLRSFDNIDVYVAGGKMRQSGSITDSLAAEFVNNIHFDLCFITGAGLTADFGLSNGTDETATFQRTIIKNSRRKVLLIPGKKIGQNSFIKVCSANSFNMLITDWDCCEDDLTALSEKIEEIIVVEDDEQGRQA